MVRCSLAAKGGEYDLRMLRTEEETKKEGEEKKVNSIVKLWRAG
jgi:hypothetical protein